MCVYVYVYACLQLLRYLMVLGHVIHPELNNTLASTIQVQLRAFLNT